MRRVLTVLLLLATLTLSGCFAPKEQATARNWRPLGSGGLTLGQLLAVSPCVRALVWESFAGVDGQMVVRVSVEYDPVRASGGCAKPAPGTILATRCFLLLDLSVTPAGDVAFVAAKAQAYSATGSFEEYPLDLGVMAAIVARAFPLPCADLGLPDYL